MDYLSITDTPLNCSLIARKEFFLLFSLGYFVISPHNILILSIVTFCCEHINIFKTISYKLSCKKKMFYGWTCVKKGIMHIPIERPWHTVIAWSLCCRQPVTDTISFLKISGVHVHTVMKFFLNWQFERKLVNTWVFLFYLYLYIIIFSLTFVIFRWVASAWLLRSRDKSSMTLTMHSDVNLQVKKIHVVILYKI